MVSQELGIGLALTFLFLLIFGVLLYYSCKKRCARVRQADLETGQGTSGLGSPGGLPSSPNYTSHTQSQYPQSRAPIFVYNAERQPKTLDSRQPFREISVAEPQSFSWTASNSLTTITVYTFNFKTAKTPDMDSPIGGAVGSRAQGNG